jgi:hypothetical protein
MIGVDQGLLVIALTLILVISCSYVRLVLGMSYALWRNYSQIMR